MLRARAARATALLATAAALAALAGCGGDDSDEPAAQPAGDEVAGSVVQYADCEDWNRASEEEKQATITALRNELTPQGDATPDSALSPERAYRVLSTSCEQSFARKMRLYKLFVKAQGFAPLAE